jgi:hypothetical protein
MKALLAHIARPEQSENRRRESRRTLRLDVSATTSTRDTTVVIQNLSRTGLQIETGTDFAIDEIFLLVLPELGATPARVRWRDARRFGCEFLSPVTSSAVSAALLMAPHEDGAPLPVADIVVEVDDAYARAAPHLALSAGATILFSAVIIMFLVAMASLSFGAR